MRQFLDYARKAPQAPAAEVDLTAAVAAAVQRARIDAEPDSSVELAVAPGVRVRGFAIEIDRALDNLLTNAVRYGRDPDTGRLNVTVSLTSHSDHATVAVIDQGSGVSTPEIDRLLRPFERGEAARSGSTGAGLGLPIVDRIARMHAGSLRLLPNSPRGLRAEMTITR